MKFHQIKDLLAVAQKRSFRAAARERESTQPTMSRSVHDLEKELGVVLFERSAHGVVLTAMGERFVSRAGAAMAELQRARDEIAQLKGENAGTLVACLSTGAQARLLPYALRPFRQRFARVQLRVIEGLYDTVERGLKDGQIDIYVGPAPAGGIDSGLVAEALYENPLIVVARTGHPLAQATSIVELKEAHWIGATMARQVDNLQALFAQEGLAPPEMLMLCETTYTLSMALRHSDLLALVPQAMLEVGAEHGLVPLPIRERPQGNRSMLVYRSGLPLTPAAEWFCDLLRRANEQRAAEASPLSWQGGAPKRQLGNR